MLTQAEQDDLVYVLSLAEDGESRLLDLSDDRQYRVAIAMQNLGGHTAETRPGMHAALEDTRRLHQAEGGVRARFDADGSTIDEIGFRDGAQVTDISRVVDTQQPASNGFVGFLAGTLQLNATISVVDTRSGTTLATGSGSQYGQGQYLPLFAAPAGGAQAAQAMTGSVFFAFQPRPGAPWQTGFVKRDVQLGVAADPVVTHPNKHQTVNPSSSIRIALGRGQNQQNDVDYWYWYQQPTTIYAIPFVGFVDFAANVRQPVAQNVTIFGQLARDGEGKGGYAALPDTARALLMSRLVASGRRLAWTLAPPADQPPWGSMGQPLQWGQLNWNSGETDYVTLQLFVNLEGQAQPAVATIQSATGADSDPLDGTKTIPTLQFLWSCLAAGTPVLLGDGSSTPIEQVVRGTVVRCGDGVDREVVQTTQFHHGGEVLRLRTDGGHELVLSHNHPVATPDGARRAHDLEVGSVVAVEHGTATVTSVESEPFEGLLCNLSLSADGDPDPAASTFLAAGVEVGDYELQVAYDSSWRTDPTRIRDLLERRYHGDFEQFLSEGRSHAGA
jgi:hypothetical protein